MTGAVVTVLSMVAYLVALRALLLRLPPVGPFEDDTVETLGCLILALPAALAVQGIAHLFGIYP